MAAVTMLPAKTATLSEETKSRLRKCMGYLDVKNAATYGLGVPSMVHPQFAIERAMEQINIAALPLFMEALANAEQIEKQVFCGADLTEVESVGDIKVNRARMKELAATYKIAQTTIANLLGIPPNPYDMRQWLRNGSVNARVR
jgi:hypothetical protein